MALARAQDLGPADRVGYRMALVEALVQEETNHLGHRIDQQVALLEGQIGSLRDSQALADDRQTHGLEEWEELQRRNTNLRTQIEAAEALKVASHAQMGEAQDLADRQERTISDLQRDLLVARRVEPLPPAMLSLEAQLAGSSPQHPVYAPALPTHLRCPTCAVIPLAHEVLEDAVETQRVALEASAVTLSETNRELDRLREQTPLQTQLEAAAAADQLASMTRERDALNCRQDETNARLNAAEFQLAATHRQLVEAETGRDRALVKLTTYRQYLPAKPK